MGDIPPSDGDRPRIDLLEPGDEPEGRGFAASGGSEEDKERPGLGLEADPVDASHASPGFRHGIDNDFGHERRTYGFLISGSFLSCPEQHFRKLDEAVSRMALRNEGRLVL